MRLHSAMKAASAGVLLGEAQRPTDGSARPRGRMRRTACPGRVVKTSMRSSCPAMSKKTRAPSDRPIQFSCISRTRSGQRSRPPIASSSSSVKAVMRRNHCDRRRFSTIASGSPAAAVDHLLVGQHGVLDRVPIDPRLLAVGEPGREEVEKHLLLVPVIFRMAGRRSRATSHRRSPCAAAAPASSRCCRRSRSAGWIFSAIAAFSAGSPKASHPIGCSTLKPCARR